MDTTGVFRRTEAPRRAASSRATRWLPPATRQDGRRPNPAVTSLTADAASTPALTPLVASTRDR